MMIQVERLTKFFGPVLAVDNVSFEVDKGQIVGFLGLNGAGKTTTMQILTTYLSATSGVARIAGFDVMSQSMEVRQNIGYLPDSVPLYGEMRVEAYLDFRAKLKGVDRKTRAKRLEYCLERCRIREVRRRLNHTLSKGYRQRVGLADAMIHDPRVLILDEPTAGLDPVQQDETLRLIQELGQDHTIIFSTHRLNEVEVIADQVVVINRGRLRLHRRFADLDREVPIVAEVRGDTEKVLNLLKSVEGVAKVHAEKLEADVNQFVIRTRGHQDIREAILQKLVSNGLPPRRVDRQTLQEFFLDLMRRGDTAPAEPFLPGPSSESVKPDGRHVTTERM